MNRSAWTKTLTDPDRYVQWMGARANLDPVPGGTYQVVVFSWGWNQDRAVPPGSTRVVVTLEPDDGGTRVTLRHYGLPDDDQRRHHGQRWHLYLDRLQVVVSGRDPDPDPNA
jgi:uncharacterized protein YndB with AHSA1/START domain